jgi:PAS domain S-box-containing protein
MSRLQTPGVNHCDRTGRRYGLTSTQRMTTLRKLWFGFGTLTVLLALACGALFGRVDFIVDDIKTLSEAARPRSVAVTGLEINVINYALAVLGYLQTGNPRLREMAAKHAAATEHHLDEYERLARDLQHRELVSRFDTLWREFRVFGQTLIESNDRPVKPVVSRRFADLRLGLVRFLNDEMRVEALARYDAHKSAMLHDVQTVLGVVLAPLLIGVIISALTSVAVGRGLVRTERAAAEHAERFRLAAEAVNGIIYEHDLQTGAVERTRGLSEVVGYHTGEVPPTAQWWLEQIHPDDRQTSMQRLEAQIAAGTSPLLGDYRVRHKDGRWLHVEDRAVLIEDAEGRPVKVVGCTVDITKRKQAEEGLRQSESRYRELVQNANSAIVRWKTDGTITFFNEYAQSLFGYPAQEAIGRHVGMIVPEQGSSGADRSQLVAGIASRPECYWENINENLCRDGRRIWMVWTNKPVRNEQGQVEEILAIGSDISKLKAAEAALQEADRRKDEFLATLAHELRNPLAPIRNAVQILKRQGLPEPVLQAARGLIDRQLHHLVRLIDDLLDVSRITRGRLELCRERVALGAVLEQALEASRPQVERAGHELTVLLPPQPIDLSADPVRLAQVFLNLLNNACHYTEPGGRIRLTAEREGANAVIAIQDTGIGIAPEHLPFVFEMFSQVGSVVERSQGGLGIGLALARGLVEMHGGRIEARSEGPGKGSEFIVRLPALREASNLRLPQPRYRDGRNTARAHHILVVDDNRDHLESLALLLRLSGNEVRTADDGFEALETAARYRPDVVLLDIGMPKLDGYAVCRHLREHPWGKAMVIIALTGWGRDEDRRNTEKAGFSGHLVKPVEESTLLQLLAEDGRSLDACGSAS